MKETIILSKLEDRIVLKENDGYESYNQFVIGMRIKKISNSEIVHVKIIDGKPAIEFENYNVILDNDDLFGHKTLKILKTKVQSYFKKVQFEKFKKNIKYKLQYSNGFKVIAATVLIPTIMISIPHIKALDVKPLEVNTSIEENIEEIMEYREIENELENLPIEISSYKKFEQEKYENEESLSYEEKLIKKYADMYFIDYELSKKIISNTINFNGNFEIEIINAIRNYYLDNENIDKTPIVSTLKEEEKEKIMLDFAEIYGIEDIDTLATLIAIHRLETSYGTSALYINSNNCGGNYKFVDGEASLATYKTIEIGAESFVRNFLYNINLMMDGLNNNDSRYNKNNSLEQNLDVTYCTDIIKEGNQEWHEIVSEIKEKILDEDILNKYRNVKF